MIKFGINTWFFQEYSVKYALKKIREIGFQAAEIWMEHLLKTNEKPEDIRDLSKKLDLELSLHATSYDINLTSINRGIREESKRQAVEAITMGNKIGANIVVIHPGRLSASRVNKTECWNDMIEVLKYLDEIAERESIKIGLEAMEKRPKEILVTPEDVHFLFDKNWKNIGLTLDIAHANTLEDPIQYMKKINKSWIYHLHISDATPDRKHIPLGQGNIDINSVLATLKKSYNGLIIIEGYVPHKGEQIAKANFNYVKSTR
ncbi:MAG: sugar phosphate isomerase/epimerase [Spirochaetaceae bacterium]|nr:sugar phosphate isomerase/epimerase [Spirochaetaceae bacterium]